MDEQDVAEILRIIRANGDRKSSYVYNLLRERFEPEQIKQAVDQIRDLCDETTPSIL